LLLCLRRFLCDGSSTCLRFCSAGECWTGAHTEEASAGDAVVIVVVVVAAEGDDDRVGWLAFG
jgi:hypothetical protein